METARDGFFSKWFGKKEASATPVPPRQKVADPVMDPRSDTVPPKLRAEPTLPRGTRERRPVERFPEIPGYESFTKASQEDIEALIAKDLQGLRGEDRTHGSAGPPQFPNPRVGSVPTGFPTVWHDTVVDFPLGGG